MKQIPPMFLLAAAVLAAPAAAQRDSSRGEAQLAREVAGRVAGQPVNCLTLSRIQASRIIDRTAIIYEAGRTVYVNRPRSGANWLDRDDIMVNRTTGSQLCRSDTVRLVNRGTRTPSGFVILDRFVPYTRPRANR